MAALLTMGIVLGLSAGLSPGPLMTFVIAQSLHYGAREGVKVAMVPLITDLPIILISTLVLARLRGLDPVLGGITLAGGLFLSYLAYAHLRTGNFDPNGQQAAPHSVLKGVLVNVLSPNPCLFWLTVGAPIVLQGWEQSAIAAAAFLAGFYGCLCGAKILVALLVGRSRRFFAGKAYVYVMRTLGALLFVFALLMFRNAFELFLK